MRPRPRQPLRRGLEAAARVDTLPQFKKGLGSPALFGIVQGFVAASIYFAVGVVAARALGLTWLVFLFGVVFFAAIVPSYVEGASLHQERGGATVIARYAFNELWSFVAGWAICLDYLILIALTAYATTDYAAVFWDPFDSGVPEFLLAAVVIVAVAAINVRGSSPRRFERTALLVLADLVLQLVVVAFGLALVFEPEVLTDPWWTGAPALDRGPSVRLPAGPRGLQRHRRLLGTRGPGGDRPGRLRRLIGVRLLAAAVPTWASRCGVDRAARAAGTGWIEAPMVGVADGLRRRLAARAAALPAGASAS
jgi:APA family basic amino acid/polyamine antiporter